MISKDVFNRCEMKYLLSKDKYEALFSEIGKYLSLDEYPQSTIQSLYYDTYSRLLIRRSIEKPVYKEKLRIRSYGLAEDNDKVFVELKKKYRDVVFKRRIKLSYAEAVDYIQNSAKSYNRQIAKEIEYFKGFYGELMPSMLLIYDRISYVSNDGAGIRITIDSNILYRDYELNLNKGFFGESLLNDGNVLLEIKTAAGLPLWLTHALAANGIYKTSFSKYGEAYKATMTKRRAEYVG